MLKGFIWVIFTAVVVHRSDGLHCFSCSILTEENDCSIVTKCLSDQKCFAQRSGHGNQTRFNLGCIESQRCPDHHDFTIVGRSTPDQCLECCLQDGCNKELCEIQHVSDVHNPGTCADDQASNCTQLSKLINICSDVSHAKNICRKYCGLCSLVDGDWSKWSDWTPCSTSCGVGTHTRQRNCTDPVPQNGGDYCLGNDTQVQSCFLRACPVHGEWSGWGVWEGCSVSCGEGVMKRHRTCTNPSPSLYGHYCIGDPVDYNICHEQPCGNVTKSSGTQHVSCNDVLTECLLLNRTTNICGLREHARKVCARFCGLCSIVDGQWSSWSAWSVCSTSCDNGTWARSRTCTNPVPANGGKPCVGNSSETGICHLRECPVHGAWSPWAHWTSCSSTCGQGITKRYRSCTNPRPSLLGNNCFGDSTEYGMCVIKSCPVDGLWTTWLQWSSCSVTCGSGQRTRQRLCSNPGPVNGGKDCPGVSSEHVACQIAICPVNGDWSAWSSWSSCSKSCNGGERKRHRSCSNPSPNALGKPCGGNSDQTSVCNGHPCPGNQIGFTASGNQVTSKLTPCGIFCSWLIRFTNVKSNYGNCYSPTTGKFTCKYPGLYHFAVRLIYVGSCNIYKNLVAIQDAYSHSNETNAFIDVHLNTADTVYVRCFLFNLWRDPTSVSAELSSFSGFLVTAD